MKNFCPRKSKDLEAALAAKDEEMRRAIAMRHDEIIRILAAARNTNESHLPESNVHDPASDRAKEDVQNPGTWCSIANPGCV